MVPSLATRLGQYRMITLIGDGGRDQWQVAGTRAARALTSLPYWRKETACCQE